MSRLVVVLVVVLVTALTAGSVLSSASTGVGQATGAAKKCKKTKKKKCKKTTTAVALKDGDYTYKQASVGSAPVNTLTISGKGTKIRIRELYFSSGESPGGLKCAATMIDFGTYPLRRTGDLLTWSPGRTPVTVPPIQIEGAGGGTGTTSGEINVKTLVVNVNTDVVMKNISGQNGSGCGEGHRYEDVQKLKRK
jgi:hypothetical protein